MILDACRNNPFTRSLRSASRGLAVMETSKGLLIAYSAAPGAVAEDGDGRNSPYTTALTHAILEVHEPVMEVFQDVRETVLAATGQRQIPGEYSEVVGHFYFTTPARLTPQPAPALPPAPAATGPAVPLPAAALSPTASPDETASHGPFSSLQSWLAGLFSSSAPSAAGSGASRPSPAPAILPNRLPPGAEAAAVPSPSIAGARAVKLFEMLGIQAQDIDAAHAYSEAPVRQILERAPRHVKLGSTPEQLRGAFTLCKRYVSHCDPQWYGEDERLRNATLQPFALDELPVSVGAFREFAERTHYVTHAERVGFAFALKADGSGVEQVDGGSRRNAPEEGTPRKTIRRSSGLRSRMRWLTAKPRAPWLPTEDEWEYVARGPTRSIFPWGDDPKPVARTMRIAPHVMDGPGEGIGGHYKGLAGNVWQWVDTSLYTRCDPNNPSKYSACKVLKGGSWLESNPANKRAATRRYEYPTTADEDSGFRCARTVSVWPDADLWLSQLH